MDAFRFSTTDHVTRERAARHLHDVADQIERSATVQVCDGEESATLTVPERVFLMTRVEVELDEYEVELRVFW